MRISTLIEIITGYNTYFMQYRGAVGLFVSTDFLEFSTRGRFEKPVYMLRPKIKPVWMLISYCLL